MLNILNKEIIPSPMQDKFNARFYDILKSKKIPYEELSQQNKHNLVLKYAQVSKPDVVKRGFIRPLYINSPDIVVILRTNSIKESEYRIINEIKSPIMQVTNKLIHELGFCNPYITNLSFHITDSFNDWTLEKLQKEFLINSIPHFFPHVIYYTMPFRLILTIHPSSRHIIINSTSLSNFYLSHNLSPLYKNR